MLQLSTVLSAPDLGLKSVTQYQDDPEIVWAHVSELQDPTPWLVGGELVLTTGLSMNDGSACFTQYCESLVTAGVAALGISTGGSLPHAEIPENLILAAQHAKLPLIHVPEDTPLQRVVRFVSDVLSEENSQQLERALLAQRQMSEAAASSNGVQAVLHILDANAGFSSAVYDPTLHLLAATSDVTQSIFSSHYDEIRQHMRKQFHWSISSNEGANYSSITPLYAAKNLRGLIVTVKQGPLNQYDQMILSTAFSLLRVLLELRYTAMLENRQARARVVDALLQKQLSSTAAALHLARVNVEAERLQCIVLPASTTDMQINSLLSDVRAQEGETLIQRHKSELIVLFCDPPEDFLAVLSRSMFNLEIKHVGAGSAVRIKDAKLSLRQARRARALAQERGMNLVSFPQLASYKALLLMGDQVSRAALADAVLSPLDAHDQRSASSLIEVLGAYFKNVGNIEGAAEDLHIHRHTMRSRLKKISELTNRDFRNASDVLELWLACEIREIEPGTQSAGSPE